MATTVLILPPSDACSASDIERWISAETEELAIEIFATCYGCTMPQAWNRAIAELPDLALTPARPCSASPASSPLTASRSTPRRATRPPATIGPSWKPISSSSRSACATCAVR